MNIGKRLRKMRTQKGLSQGQLAAPLFTHAYVSSIEAGRRTPSERALRHFAANLGVDVEELRSGRPAGLEQELELALQEARQMTSSGDMDQAGNRYVEIEKSAKRFGLDRLAVRAMFGLAHVDERRGRWGEAIERYDAAEQSLDDRFPDVQADIVAGKARCLENLGDTSHAVYTLDYLLKDFKRRAIEDPVALVKLHAGLAFAAHEAGLYTRASESAREALRLATSVKDPLSLATMHINSARVLLHEGERDAAVRSLLRAEELFDQEGLQVELGRAHVAHAFMLSREGKFNEAAHYLEIASTMLETSGTIVDRARVSVELGRVNRLRGKHKVAGDLLSEAIELLHHQEHVAEMALAHRELGLALFELEPERAEKNLREAVNLYERAGSSVHVALAHRYLGELYEATGRNGCPEFRLAATSLPEEL